MIAKLSGLLDSIREGHAVIDVNGVGYLVFCSSRTLGLLPARGQPVSLQIETQVREDHIHLYGFGSDAERENDYRDHGEPRMLHQTSDTVSKVFNHFLYVL